MEFAIERNKPDFVFRRINQFSVCVGNRSIGTLLRTTDGGTTWTSEATGTSDWLFSIDFVDSEKGWVVGSTGTILHTGDGGISWEMQSSGTSYQLNDVFFVDDFSGWAVGSVGTLLHTSDGGSNWLAGLSGTTHSFHGVHFANHLTGWLAGELGLILATGNGGVVEVEESDEKVHASTAILDNYPNPFNSVTTIRYYVPFRQRITLMVFDLLGREVAVVKEGWEDVGFKSARFESGVLPSGIYFYRLAGDQGILTKKMIILR